MYSSKKSRCFIVAFAAGLIAVFSTMISAKSMYVIANINANPSPVQTYDIQLAPTYLVFQASANVPALAGGAVGLGLDETNEKLFVTYEGSNTIQLVDAKTFTVLGQTSAPGASNLAGITVDQGKSRVYAVDRNTNNLYVYDWVSATNTLTQVNGGGASGEFDLAGVVSAHGLALDETRGRLYIGDRASTVIRYFDTTAFAAAGNYDQALSGQTAMGIAVDSVRNAVYTGNAYGPFGSKGMLVKYDLNTSTETFFTLPGAPIAGSGTGDNIVGVAVDEDTGNVFVTTGNQGSGGTDTVIVFNSSLTVVKNDVADIGNPTGIAIPRTQISFNPLNFTKMDNADPIASGSNLTYMLCYDNTANMTPVSNVVITDDIPAGTTFVSATGPFATTPTTVTWSIASVAAGAAQVCYDFVVNVTAADGATLLNSATIDSTETPPTTQTESTAVSAGGNGNGGGVTFEGEGDGGIASASPMELMFAMMLLPLVLARRMGRTRSMFVLAMMGVVFALTISTTALAAGKGWYAGVGTGAAHTDIRNSEYDADLLNLGYTTSSNISNNALGWKLFAGYQLNNTWDIELSYVDLGDVESTTLVTSPALPTSVEQQQFVDAAATVHPYSIDALALVGKANWSLNKDFSAFGKLGVFAWQAEILVQCVGCATAVSAPDDESGFDWTAGFGMLYKYSKEIGVRVEYDRFSTDRHDLDFVSLSVQSNF